MKKKKILFIGVLLILAICCSNKVEAASTKTDIVFDSQFYADQNGDLKQAFGYNYNKLYNHFTKYGIKEGRRASLIFNVKEYLELNEDVKYAFGNDYVEAYNHFLNYGINEHRRSSYAFDVGYYMRLNGDVTWAYKSDAVMICLHFLNNGLKEGRVSSQSLSVRTYLNNYKDLQNAYGNDYKSAFLHYILYGRKEGRNGKTGIEDSKPTEPVEPNKPIEPTREELAIESAKNYLIVKPFSRKNLIKQLSTDGFTNSEATYGVDNCGADWNEQAVKKANEYMENFQWTPDDPYGPSLYMTDLLMIEGFSCFEVLYGVRNYNSNSIGTPPSLEKYNYMLDLIRTYKSWGYSRDEAIRQLWKDMLPTGSIVNIITYEDVYLTINEIYPLELTKDMLDKVYMHSINITFEGDFTEDKNKRYHTIDCSCLDEMDRKYKGENKLYMIVFLALYDGYEPCTICNPQRIK